MTNDARTSRMTRCQRKWTDAMMDSTKYSSTIIVEDAHLAPDARVQVDLMSDEKKMLKCIKLIT